MIDAEQSAPAEAEKTASTSKETLLQNLIEKAPGYVELGRKAKDVGDDATLADINAQIKHDFDRIREAQAQSKPEQPLIPSDKDASLEEINFHLKKALQSAETPIPPVKDASLEEINSELHKVLQLMHSNYGEKILPRDLLAENVAIHSAWEATTQQWQETLAAVPEFDGNVENAIRLLTHFSGGMENVWKKANSRQQNSFDAPALIIYFGDKVQSLSIQYDKKNNVIGIGRDFLAELSRMDPESIFAFKSNFLRGEAIFIGKVGDFARLSGVEETQHAERNKRMNGIESTNPQEVSTLAEYDALDAEYEALLWQLDDATQQKMPVQTIQHLQQRIKNADKVRDLSRREGRS